VQASEKEGHFYDVLVNQIARAAQAITIVTLALTALCSFVALTVSAFVVNPIAAATIVVAVTALFFLLRPLSMLGRRQGRKRSVASLEYSGTVSEALRLVEDVHVFGVQDQERRRVSGALARLLDPYFKAQLLSGIVPAAYQGAVIILILLGLAAVYEVGNTGMGSLGAVVLILIRALSYSQTAQTQYHQMNDTLPYIEVVLGHQDRYRESALPTGGRALPVVGSLSFERVSFSYLPGRPVLRDISFSVKAGEAIGIVGPTGAGKSTLVQLLLRLREPVEGRYLLNGTPASELSFEDWHEKVAYLSQEPRLLNASVVDNIRFMREGISDDRVRGAARMANIHEEVESMALGYDTPISERAEAVSGGQRQRICLARALAGSPAVLVLDEPTSALDVRSEKLIQEAMGSMRGQLTLFVVAHRMSMLNVCDRIMVINEGRMQDFAPRAELASTNAWYGEAVRLASPDLRSVASAADRLGP
jgi:ABC-type multidrug transport system fused ATPase/permease subunit